MRHKTIGNSITFSTAKDLALAGAGKSSGRIVEEMQEGCGIG